MDNIKKINFNKTYIIQDIMPTGYTELSKFSTLTDISNCINNENEYYFSTQKDKTYAFFCQIAENEQSSLYLLPIQCTKIGELITYLKSIFKERTQQKLFPFYFYIRKCKNNQELLFIPLNKHIRQLLFGLYAHFYEKESIIKGFLYGFICAPKLIKIYKTNIQSQDYLNIFEDIDTEFNNALKYNCMVCNKLLINIKENQCKKCNWALYCSSKCFNDVKFQKHISDNIFRQKMDYYTEVKI